MALALEFNIELELELVVELEFEGCDVVLGLKDKDVPVAAVITPFLTELLSDNFEYVSLILLFKVDTDDMDDEGSIDDVDRDNDEEGAVEEEEEAVEVEEEEEEEGAEEEDNKELLFSPIRAGLLCKVELEFFPSKIIFFPSKSGIFCNKLEVLEAVPEAL